MNTSVSRHRLRNPEAVEAAVAVVVAAERQQNTNALHLLLFKHINSKLQLLPTLDYTLDRASLVQEYRH